MCIVHSQRRRSSGGWPSGGLNAPVKALAVQSSSSAAAKRESLTRRSQRDRDSVKLKTAANSFLFNSVYVEPKDVRHTHLARNSPIHLAADKDNVQLLKVLLEQGTSPNYVIPETGDTALHAAAKRGRIAATTILLHHGADFTVRNGRGNTPLNCAVLASHPKTAAILLSYARRSRRRPRALELEPDLINISNNKGNTPLHSACLNNDIAMVELLVSDDNLKRLARNANGFKASDLASCPRIKHLLGLEEVMRRRATLLLNSSLAIQIKSMRVESKSTRDSIRKHALRNGSRFFWKLNQEIKQGNVE